MTNDDLNYDELDPHIRETVRWLRSRGFTTTDSGDGVSKLQETCADADILPFPHVFMMVTTSDMVAEADRLRHLLEVEHGIKLSQAVPDEDRPYVDATYLPVNGTAMISLFHVADDDIVPFEQRAS